MHWVVGDVRVTKVVEHELAAPFESFLSGAPDHPLHQHPRLAPHFVDADGNARTSIHGLVVDTGTSRILVDTCIGPMREMAGVPAMPSDFLHNLAVIGYRPDDIDSVVCTHLHFDHVGWNTQLVADTWQPTFPHARYLIGRREWQHWQANTSSVVDLTETVRPIVAAGRAELVEADHRLSAEVRFEPVPGHTPGQLCVHVESRGEHAVITGDLAHHPIQLADPDICSLADSDPVESARTRRRFCRDRTIDQALVIGTHFPGPTAGHIVADGPNWHFAV